MAEIEDLKARFSHQMPDGKIVDLMKILIKIANKKMSPVKRVTIRTRSNESKSSNAESNQSAFRCETKDRTEIHGSRHIPADVKRELEKSRHLGCNHVDSSGVRCGSAYFLQMDHIVEFRNNGSNEANNLRWMCGLHNRNRIE